MPWCPRLRRRWTAEKTLNSLRYSAWTSLAVSILAIVTALADQRPPVLTVDVEAVSDEIVVSAIRPRAAPQDIVAPIRSHDVDLGELTSGLLESGKPADERAAALDQRVAGALANPR